MSSVFDEVQELFNDLIKTNGSGAAHDDMFNILNRDKYWNNFEPYLKYFNIIDNPIWDDYYLMLTEPQEYEQIIYIYDIYENLMFSFVLWNKEDVPEINSNLPYVVMEFKEDDGAKLYVTNKFERPPTYKLNNHEIDGDEYYKYVEEVTNVFPSQFPLIDNLIVENKLWTNSYDKSPYNKDKLFFIKKSDVRTSNLINSILST